MKIDLHTHTIASGHAFGTLFENVKEARSKGIELLAVTDHGPTLPGSAPRTYFMCGDRIPKVIEGVRVLFGVEANIINDEGKLDLSDKILKKLDIVIIGFHYNCGYIDQGIEKNTKVLIRAMQNPYVKMISHPYISKTEVNIEKITKEAIKRDILLEINASCFLKNRIKDEKMWSKLKIMIKILKDNNKKMIISSDAHSPYEIGQFDVVIDKFNELGIDKNDLLNNDKEAVLKFFNIS